MELSVKKSLIKQHARGEIYDLFVRIGFCMLILRLFSGVFISEFSYVFSGNALIYTLLSLCLKIQNGLIVLSLPFCFLRQPKRCCIALFATITVCALNILLWSDSQTMVLHEARNIFIQVLAPLLICLAVDIKSVWKSVKLFGYIGAVMCLLVTVIYALGKNSLHETANYDMTYSYALLVPALILLATFFAERKIVCLLLSAVLMLAALKYGARGPVVCYLTGGAVMLLAYLKRKSETKNVRTETVAKQNFIFAVCVVLAVLFIAAAGLLVMKNLGIKTGIRSIDVMMLSSGSDSGRAEFHYLPAMKHIADDSIFAGDGLFSDRQYLYDHIKSVAPHRLSSSEALYGCYCHNIVLELMFHFGLIAGLAIFAGLVWLIISAFRRGEGIWTVCIFIGMSAALFISGSYLTYASLWMLTGLCINIINRRWEEK